jgi:phosphatidylserine decarboxylase
VRKSPAEACADKLIWRFSVMLICGMGIMLAWLWDHTLSLAVIGGAGSLWCVVAGFINYFFRDPDPNVPTDPNVVVAPAHGLVDVIDEVAGVEFMGECCRRISIFLSVFDVHVQYAPAAGRVVALEHRAGLFLNALNKESAHCNENVFIGIECRQRPGERVAVRQIAGVIARRIVNWVNLRDAVDAGQRLGLIQFGSRCDLYLPLTAQLQVQCGDRVIGGETVVGVVTAEQYVQIRPVPSNQAVTKASGAPRRLSRDSLRYPP